MPESFDPAWEYFEPDPEVAELFVLTGTLRRFEVFGIEDFRTERLGGNIGVRFGRGNPDHFSGMLARTTTRGEYLADKYRLCPTCGFRFTPSRSERKHCSNACYLRRGRSRTPPDAVSCEHCGGTFNQNYLGHRYCSLKCFNEQQKADWEYVRSQRPVLPSRVCGRPRILEDRLCPATSCNSLFRPSFSGQKYCSTMCRDSSRKPTKINDERFAKLYLAGYTISDIAAEFRVTTAACRVARKRLGLPPRKES